MIVGLFGPPGCGKGTQARYLVQKYGMVHLSAGDVLRAEAKTGSALGQKLQSFMSTGGLLSDDIIVDIMESKITENLSNHILLDGFPRSIGQMSFCMEYIKRVDGLTMSMICLEVDADKLVERIAGRRVCKRCGATYGALHGADVACDVCGSKDFEKRADDSVDTFMSRMDEYRKTTLPMIESAAGMLKIDGDAAPEIVSARLCEILDDLIK